VRKVLADRCLDASFRCSSCAHRISETEILHRQVCVINVSGALLPKEGSPGCTGSQREHLLPRPPEMLLPFGGHVIQS